MKSFGLALLAALGACGTPPGESPPDASTPPDGPTGDADVRPHELRGVWITRFAYTSQASLEAIIDRAADAHFNAVFVQIRGEADAYYRSAYEPWSQRLSGVLGRDPGWDPLQVAIDRAHARGMELHA
ncbi:MAG TPA: family 10 glycosylhydrolase, partial [Kofleriaceae bacterium]|nr:family 10 glycosylhydrolase [Kofleriaceae bacterium]